MADAGCPVDSDGSQKAADGAFQEQVSQFAAFLRENGFLLTALELRQELFELRPGVVVPALEELLSAAEADALAAESPRTPPRVPSPGPPDGASDEVLPTNDSPYSKSPPGSTDHRSSAYLQYRLRLLEEELAACKAQLSKLLRRRTGLINEAVSVDLAPNPNESGPGDAGDVPTDCLEAALGRPERAALHSLVQEHLLRAGLVGAAAALEAEVEDTHADLSPASAARGQAALGGATSLESLLQRGRVADANCKHLRDDIHAQRNQNEELSAALQDARGRLAALEVAPLSGLMEVVQEVPTHDISSDPIPGPVLSRRREDIVCITQDEVEPDLPKVPCPDVQVVIASAREALENLSSNGGNAGPAAALLRRSLPLLLPAVSFAHRTLLAPLLILVAFFGPEADAKQDGINLPPNRIVSTWLRLFGPRPLLLEHRLCVAGTLAVLCSWLDEQRLESEILASLVVEEAAAAPLLRRLVADCLGVVLVAAAARGELVLRPASSSRCLLRLAELAEDPDPAVRAAAVAAAGSTLPHVSFRDDEHMIPIARILKNILCESDLRVLCAAHSFMRHLLASEVLVQGWIVNLWEEVLPPSADLFSSQPDGSLKDDSALRITLLLELLCAFIRNLTSLSTMRMASNAVDMGGADVVADANLATKSLGWLPSGDGGWSETTSLWLQEAQECERWNAICPVHVAHEAPQPHVASAALQAAAASFCMSVAADTLSGNPAVGQHGPDATLSQSNMRLAVEGEVACQDTSVGFGLDRETEVGGAVAAQAASGVGAKLGFLGGQARGKFSLIAGAATGAVAKLGSHLDSLAREEELRNQNRWKATTENGAQSFGNEEAEAAVAEIAADDANTRAVTVPPSAFSSASPSVSPPLSPPAGPSVATPEEALTDIVRHLAFSAPPLQSVHRSDDSQMDNVDWSSAFFVWLCRELLPFVLSVAQQADWLKPSLEPVFTALTHFLSLLGVVMGPEFQRRVLVVAFQKSLSVAARGSWATTATKSESGIDGEARGIGDFVVPCAPLSLVCCRVLVYLFPTEAAPSFGLASLTCFAAGAYGWSPNSEASIDLFQALWRDLTRQGQVSAGAAVAALWPCVHHDNPRMRLAAAIAFGALASEAAAFDSAELPTRSVLPALLALGADEDRAVLVRAVVALGELWLNGLPEEGQRQVGAYFDSLVQRDDPMVLLVAVRVFGRLAADAPVSNGSDLLEASVLPHLSFLAFARGQLQHHSALQAAIFEALLAAAQKRPALSGEVMESLVVPALREQARKLPEHSDRLQEVLRQLVFPV